MDFYNRVRMICRQRGINISDLGKFIGIPLNRSTISRWKQGAVPRNATLKAIADYFDVTVEYLISDDEPVPQSTAGGLSDDALKIALFRGTEGITDEMLEEVLAFADYVKAKNKK